MSITFNQPLEYPAALVKRNRLPNFIYVVIDDIAFPTTSREKSTLPAPHTESYLTKRNFTWDDITKKAIITHMNNKTRKPNVSNFVSAYENEATALKHAPVSSTPRHKGYPCHATKLILCTKGLVPAWVEVSSGVHIPIWIEQGQLPKLPEGVLHVTLQGFDAFEASVWICLAEIRIVLGLNEKDGEMDEWLACGYIPRERVCTWVVLHGVRTAERKVNEEELEKVGRLRRDDKLGKEKGREMIQQAPSSPQIPVRTSSLRPYQFDNRSERRLKGRRENRVKPHRSSESRDERTVRHAQSLLKQALMASLDKDMVMKLLREAKETRIRTEIKIAERGLKDKTTTPQTIEVAPRIGRESCREVLQDVQSDTDAHVTEGPHPRLAPFPRKDRQKHITFTEAGEGNNGRRSASAILQDPQLDVESVISDLAYAGLTRAPGPSQPISPPPEQHGSGVSTLNPLTIPCLERIEALQVNGIKLKAKWTALQVQNEEIKQQHNKDFSCPLFKISCATAHSQ